MNKEREPHLKATWEALISVKRINLNRLGKPPGLKPKWKFTKSHRFLERETQKGGIN